MRLKQGVFFDEFSYIFLIKAAFLKQFYKFAADFVLICKGDPQRHFMIVIAEDLNGFHFMNTPTQRIDVDTGEVLHDEQDDPLDDFDASAFDKEALCILSDLFGDDIDVR